MSDGTRYAAALSTGGTISTLLGRVGDVPLPGCAASKTAPTRAARPRKRLAGWTTGCRSRSSSSIGKAARRRVGRDDFPWAEARAEAKARQA